MTTSPKPYPEAASSPDFAAIEQAILERWAREGTFQASMDTRPKTTADGGSNEFVFYDGPPFANGLPHYGHIATAFVKDIIPRYHAMRGRHVDRIFGWDCHGLPAELEVEKEIGVSGRTAILDYGMDNFNQKCAQSVQRYTEEWEWYVNRSARWVSFDRAYRTMDLSFMESVMWAFKTLFDKGLVYEGHRVVPYSWAVQTPLSNFETRLDNSFRERADPALTVGFQLTEDSLEGLPLVGDEPVKVLAWTTTPWTLPSNLALCVSADLDYAVLRHGPQVVILAAAAQERYAREVGEAELLGTVPGSALVGRRYQPLFPYFARHAAQGAFRILAGGFVSAEDGTGVVHIAPGFGEDDLALGRENGLPLVVPVDEAGRFTAEVPDYQGLNVIHEANPQIIKDLKARGDTVLRHDQILHNYPHCWRTDEPLIYKAINSWYVAVTQFRDRMVELNQGINWIPFHVRDGQFGRWLENARDWNISRNRFWGAPIPVWKSDDPRYPRLDVYGSLEEIERDFGVRPDNLHRPMIDELVRPNPDDPSGQSMMRRVPDVLDCWFESGSMPFAQLHYPFENKERFDQNFPGDFIVEYVAQTRGWFYTLMVLSTALFDRAPFRNCICHGVVLDENNQKLSKRLKNYPDPVAVFQDYGADALRWYMMNSPLMAGGDLAMAKDGSDIAKSMNMVIRRFWNAYVFFTLYANLDTDKLDGGRAQWRASSEEPLDVYILAKTRDLVNRVQERLDAFDIPGAYEAVGPYVDALNNWYIRLRRGAFWAEAASADKQAAYDTLYTSLTTACQAMAPLLPLLSEHIYTALTGAASVHLTDWPAEGALPADAALVARMDLAREAASAVLMLREEHKKRVRLPLPSLVVAHPEAETLAAVIPILAEEVNVKAVDLSPEVTRYGTREIKVDPSLGKIYGAKMKAVFAAQRSGDWTLREDGTVEIGELVLEPGQFEVRTKTTGEGAAASFDAGRGVVVLDTTVTEALQAEGWARDIIRLIQQARKDLDLVLTDRIAVTLAVPDPLSAAVQAHRQTIAGEVLAGSLDLVATLEAPTVDTDLDGHSVSIAVKRLG